MNYRHILVAIAGCALAASGAQAQTMMGQPNTPAATQARPGGVGNGVYNGGYTSRDRAAPRGTQMQSGQAMRSGSGYNQANRQDYGRAGQNNGNGYGNNGYRNGNGYQNGHHGRYGRNDHNGWSNTGNGSMHHMDPAHVRRCKARYHTYNPSTDMFYARPGVKQRCKL